MLVQTFKPNDVVTIKLITGEEIITKLVSVDDSFYKVSKPLVLSISQQGPAMTPLLLTADIEGEISFPKNVVIVMAKTEKTTANQYIKGTSGIQPATSSDFGKLI